MAANGIEVASTYVTILAKMPGLTASVDKALGRVDVGGVSKKIGQQVAESVGKSLKDQVAKKFAEATAAALEKQTNATKRLSDAEHALVKARAQHGSTSAKVTAAEEKLEALRKAGKASAGDLEKAEAALAKAQADHVGTGRAVASGQNKVAEAKRNATEASKAYTEALAKEQSKSEQALAWMPLANARIDELSGKWKAAGAKISGVGDSLTNNVTKPVVIATGAVGTLVSALGFKRLVGIDTARGQFKGLGMDADAVMEQVDRGVTNTALSMAQGASLAVGILATGSVPLTGLEAQIKRVSNVSAAYNVEAEHAAYLLNNILTKNKVTWGDLSQMQQNQIPIVTQLADYYGVAGGEIMKMAQDGAISVEDLNTVLDINAGAAAEEYAKTWKGVTSNILSNLGKIGAKFLEPTFNIMKEEAAEFLQLLKSDEFSTIATEMGDRIGQIVRDVSAGIQSLIGWWAGLSDGQKKFIGVSALVLVAMGPVLSILGRAVGGIGAMISAVRAIIGFSAGWKLSADLMTKAQIRQSIATKTAEGATKSQTAAMKAGVVVQRIMNSTLMKSPWTWILVGIVALVAAIIHFFKNTEVGQAIFAEFSRFLGEAWANISGFFTAAYENVIKPVFDGIATVVTWVWQNVLQPIFQALGLGFAVLGGLIVGTYEALIKPVWDLFAAVVKWLWQTIVRPVFTTMGTAFKAFGLIVQALWAKYVQPVFNFIGNLIRTVWASFVKPVFDAMSLVIRNMLGPVFTWLRDSVITPVWNTIKSVIAGVWNNGIKPVIDTMVRIVRSDPKRAFEAARDAIGKAWKGIQELAAKPVRFVVNTVINGLIGTINKIPGVNIPKVSLPQGFAHGGILPGMSRMSDGDDQLIMARRGEGMMVSEALRTSADRSAFLAANAAGRRGVGFASMLQGLARGGLVHPMPGAVMTTGWYGYPGHSAVDLAKPQGTPIQAAGAGTVSAQNYHNMYGNMVDIQHGGGLSTRYAHMLANVAVRLGQVVKAGQVIGYEGSTGNSTGPHLHYEVMIGGRQVNPIPYLNGGGVKPLFGVVDGLADFATNTFKKAFPGGGMWIDAAGGIMSQGVKSVVGWATDLLSVGGDGLVPTLYDNGGWLQPGLSLVQNKTGRPEPIFTGSEFDQMVGGGRGDVYVQNPFTGEYLLAEVDERATRSVRRELAPVSAGALASSHGRRV